MAWALYIGSSQRVHGLLKVGKIAMSYSSWSASNSQVSLLFWGPPYTVYWKLHHHTLNRSLNSTGDDYKLVPLYNILYLGELCIQRGFKDTTGEHNWVSPQHLFPLHHITDLMINTVVRATGRRICAGAAVYRTLGFVAGFVKLQLQLYTRSETETGLEIELNTLHADWL